MIPKDNIKLIVLSEPALSAFVFVLKLCSNSEVFSRHKWFKFLTNYCPGFPALG